MSSLASERFLRSHLKTRHMVLLVELGRHHSILEAAKAANLTQSAASKLLSELEYALGLKLFERLPRGVLPTAYGEVLIRRAGAALAEMDAGYQEIMQLRSGLAGQVSIGSVLTPSTKLLPAAIKLLKASHQKLHVAITIETSMLLIERLRAGELDLVIGRILDADSSGELSFEPLTDEPHDLIVRSGHPLLAREHVDLADLAEACWILPARGSILRDRLTALFLSHGLDQPTETVEAVSLPMITNLLLDSDMVVALPEELVRTYLDAGLLAVLPCDLGLKMDMYGIITRKHHQLSPGALALLHILRQLGGQAVEPENRAQSNRRLS